METTRKTIFLVDDNKSNLVVGSDALAGTYKVFTFISGEKLFKVLERLKPDMILLDVEMPEMNGYDVLERLKNNSQTSQIPVIFLTATRCEKGEAKGLSMGAVDYITKPLQPSLHLERIEKYLS